MNVQNRKHALVLCAMGILCSVALSSSAATLTHDSDASLLVNAAKNNRIDIIRLLVEDGANVNARVIGDGTALIVAAKRGDLVMVNALLGMGADVNRCSLGDGNPLIAASQHGNLAVVQRLLSAGAEINAIVPGDETALINAARYDHLQIVQYLVAHGANVSLGVIANGTEWRTPLNQARSKLVKTFLISSGAVPQNNPLLNTNAHSIGTL